MTQVRGGEGTFWGCSILGDAYGGLLRRVWGVWDVRLRGQGWQRCPQPCLQRAGQASPPMSVPNIETIPSVTLVAFMTLDQSLPPSEVFRGAGPPFGVG